MIRPAQLFAGLLRDERGTMLIETAIVAPVLILLSLSAFQVSQVVARQTELQGAAAEALGIAMAAPPTTATERNTLRDVIVSSTGLSQSEVTVTEVFRCGSATTYVNSASSCTGVKIANYVRIQLTDTYSPLWTQFGIGRDLNYNVDRYVLVKQT